MNFELDIKIPLSLFLEKLKPINFIKNHKEYKIKNVITDTRKYNQKGGIFFALKGKNFDGHKFCNDIIKTIDYVVISDASCIIEKYKEKYIVVKDTILALDILANLYRLSFPELKVICVVGSNGKTTTKEIIKTIFSKKYNIVATKENFNNLIGVAYTLFSLKKDTEYCITELGISLPGEMEILGKTVVPDVVVITNIAKEHLEYFCNLDTVFVEETKILNYLRPFGVVVLNKDDLYLRNIRNGKYNIKWYSIKTKDADVYAQNIVYTAKSTDIKVVLKNYLGIKLVFDVTANILGEYNVYNILSAITAAFFSGFDDIQLIVDAIKNFSAVEMRGSKVVVKDNIILDETYNANPDSMKYTIQEFMKIFYDRKKVLVLGDMLELGESSVIEHKNIINYFNIKDVYLIYLYGPQMKYLYDTLIAIDKQKVKYFDDIELLKKDLLELISVENKVAVLVKGSRGMELDKVVNFLSSFKEGVK